MAMMNPEDQRRYDTWKQQIAKVQQGIDARQPAELQPYINDTGYRGMVPPRGGYVGAATDAQASQAMRDRADQSAASRQIIASLNAGANAERDTRAARLGIDRATMDAMEGRGQPAATGITAQTAAFDPFSRPGDSFQDTRARAALYDQTLQDAQGLPSRRQAGAVQAAQGLLAPGALQGQFAQQQGQQQAGILRGILDAQNAAATRAFEQQKFSSDQAMEQQRLGLDQNRYLLDERKAQADVVRNRALDQAKIDQQGQVSPNDIKAELMRRYLSGGQDSQAAFDALQKLFPPANPMTAFLMAPPQQ